MKNPTSFRRGYFAIGVEGISKAVNLGNLLRSAHAFGASFVFTIGADDRRPPHPGRHLEGLDPCAALSLAKPRRAEAA